ncbi:hypothetical protein [Streptomyces sp. NPDC046759]|uniref:hypothetical protein n=1 Tax=Streptomyces sp. NPDC046759 TaxID=3155019 RepID=UPI0033F14A1E
MVREGTVSAPEDFGEADVAWDRGARGVPLGEGLRAARRALRLPVETASALFSARRRADFLRSLPVPHGPGRRPVRARTCVN